MLRSFKKIQKCGTMPARFLAWAVVVGGIAALLTACGGGGSPRSGSGSGPTMTVTPIAKTAIPMQQGEVVNLEALTSGAYQTHAFDASGIPSLDTGSATRTYMARSSAPMVATVGVSNSMVMVTPQNKGTATITIEAESPASVGSSGVSVASHGGEHRMFSYMVRMPNRRPTASGTISAVTLAAVGNTDTRDVSSSFADPDGDTLSYTARSSATNVVTTSVSGSVVTVTAVRAGRVTVTVSATDNDPTNPLTATRTFSVTVSTPATGFAPADQAAFDVVAVGKRVFFSSANYVDFVSSGRFREFDDGTTSTGRYTYERTGPNMGRFESFYDDGDRCTNTLRYTSATTGSLTFTCNDGDSRNADWRLVDSTPTMPPGGSTSSGKCGTGQVSGENCIVRNVSGSNDVTLNSNGSCQLGSAISSGGGRIVLGGVNVCERAATQAGIDWTPGSGFGSGGGDGTRAGECRVGATYRPGESCEVYGVGSSSSTTFSVTTNESGRFGFFTAGNSIRNRGGTINGVTYYFVASRQGGVWRVDEYRSS